MAFKFIHLYKLTGSFPRLPPTVDRFPPDSHEQFTRSDLFKSGKAKILEHRIRKKWHSDVLYLPLCEDHFELYQIIHRHYWGTLKEFPNLIEPRGFNDRVQWLKLFDQSTDIIEHADKVQIKTIVQDKLGKGYTADMLQVGRQFTDIDFDDLPTQFVLKANHDAGSVRLIPEKVSIDRHELRNFFDAALSKKFGWEWGEWGYRFIPPKIFAESFIETDDGYPPVDYKFYCCDGRVRFMHFIYDRHISPKEQTIDVDGLDMKQSLYPSFPLGDAFTKPDDWQEMIRISEELSRGFKFVRVDLYRSSNGILVGEMTFWPMQGVYKGDGQRILGQMLDFDLTTFKPPIVNSLLSGHHNFNNQSQTN